MNNPIFSGPPDFKRISEKNRELDESDLIYSESDFSGNYKKFPTKIFVINLEDRKDRWESFLIKNAILSEKFEVIRFNAVKRTPVQKAIFESFSSCISGANDETFIIMEDDSYLVEGGLDHIIKTWSQIPGDWDVIFGNHYFFSKMQILNQNFAKPIGRASTANFGIYSNTLNGKIINYDMIEDPSLKEWDHFLTGNPDINNYVYWPMISRESGGFSDHKGRYMDINFRTREHRFRFNFLDNEKFYPVIWKT
jgi:hypothetical protein